MTQLLPPLTTEHVFLFDLDGVITPTAVVHQHAWRELFIPVLARHEAAPYEDSDYFRYIDGKPRYEGVASMLESRGINLPWGDPSDDPGTQSVCGLGNHKNEVFNAVLARDGVAPYPGSLALVRYLTQVGTPMAVVSSSKNAPSVLAAANMSNFFPLVVDGNVAARLGLAGKPDPATYLYAAEQLGYGPQQCVVVEDAESGVAAGKAGKFAHVVGVNRGAGAQTLFDYGASMVVDDLAELLKEG